MDTQVPRGHKLCMDTRAPHGQRTPRGHTTSMRTHELRVTCLPALHGSLCLFTFQGCHRLAVICSLLGVLLTPGADKLTGWGGAGTAHSKPEQVPRATDWSHRGQTQSGDAELSE